MLRCVIFGTGLAIVKGHTIQRHHVHILPLTVIEKTQLKIRVRRSIQHAPELALQRPHLDDRCPILWIGNRNVVD